MDNKRFEEIRKNAKTYRKEEREGYWLDEIEFMIATIDKLVEENEQFKKRLIDESESG
jgi:hypothetical protein